jgi:multidrug efflux pump subunit AcrB
MELAISGLKATVLHVPEEVDPLWVELRLPRASRSAVDDLQELYVQGARWVKVSGRVGPIDALGETFVQDKDGAAVQLSSLGRFELAQDDKTIYHKNLRRVVFVFGEVAGRAPADAVIDLMVDQEDGDLAESVESGPGRPVESRTWLSPGADLAWSIPDGFSVRWAGEGEWKITLDVFRDLGLAFGAALLGIFVILMFQTGSRVLPLLIMLAIPLTLIGILPGFWALNLITNRPVGGYPNPVFFTATAMIGMIALAGIVVRNSVVLIDFIHHGIAEGLSTREAVIRSVAVRTRPILLTAGTTMLGNWVITLDPVFSGLAWSIIFGIVTSTLFTLVVIPVVYYQLYGGRGELSPSSSDRQ